MTEIGRENLSLAEHGRGVRFASWRAGTPLPLGQLLTAITSATGEPHRLAPAGLRAALESQPDRSIATWLAWHTPATGSSSAEPVGLVTLVAAGRLGRVRHSIGWLLVAAAWQRRGVGTILAETAIAAARANGAHDVWVEVHRDWPTACAFWQRLGFHQR